LQDYPIFRGSPYRQVAGIKNKTCKTYKGGMGIMIKTNVAIPNYVPIVFSWIKGPTTAQ
jgi:hypothetical protein